MPRAVLRLEKDRSDGQTDGQTDRQTDRRTPLLRGKRNSGHLFIKATEKPGVAVVFQFHADELIRALVIRQMSLRHDRRRIKPVSLADINHASTASARRSGPRALLRPALVRRPTERPRRS